MVKYRDLGAYFNGKDLYREKKEESFLKMRRLSSFSIPCVYKNDYFYAKELVKPFHYIDKESLMLMLQNSSYLYLGNLGDFWCLYADSSKIEFFVGKYGEVLPSESSFLSLLNKSGIIKYIYSEIKAKTQKELSSIVVNKIGKGYNKVYMGYSSERNNCLRIFVCIG